ncbi:DUF6695 family protein [Sphingobacterium sp. LRF_L2]|uniref:DUF6695 family protein n=1 Tax=Sphingobacterium sp. LRF_L2 TaxID=3369421 RepID=UPI003F63A4A0
MGMFTFDDIAIPLAWPDQTARGDEKWMSFFKKIGLVKNLNFKVGHAAILLIEKSTGTIQYYDFGRYLVPRGYGRARSSLFDPRLALSTKAIITSRADIENLLDILHELQAKEKATHGGGRLLFSICFGVSFRKGKQLADTIVERGPILYGAFAHNNNSCSRFVAQILLAAMETTDPKRRRILYPECIALSPTSNVVNAANDKQILCFQHSNLQLLEMNRKTSLRFQYNLLKENFSTKYQLNLGNDCVAGMTEMPKRAANIPPTAQWLGGIGEGAWFHLQNQPDSSYTISKYDVHGQQEYQVWTKTDQTFNQELPFQFTFHFNHQYYEIRQEGKIYFFNTEDIHKTEQLKQQSL